MDKTHPDPALPVSSTAASLRELRGLGEYHFLRRLGEGGMGAVYLAQRDPAEPPVAIKVLSDALASSQGYVDRFSREARSGQLLNHPNIVRTLQYGQDRATRKYYLIMEFVDGPSAQALLDHHGKLSVGDAVFLILNIAQALEYAHSRNVVHRDIKPDNILITRSGVPKLADLGLARRTDEASHLTAARQGFGTTHYMPYEQAINARYADGRSDIYALGATFYHLLTGSLPFPGANHLEVIEKKNQGQFVPARSFRSDVPPVLDDILARMLARDPRDRYQTASELIVDLDRSALAAVPPSFADPERAAHDPDLQACLASSATEPTRLDPERVELSSTPTPAPDAVSTDSTLWQVRLAVADGRVQRIRATTTQILERLDRGQMSPEVEVRRLGQREGFHRLDHFPEFREVVSRKPRRACLRSPFRRSAGACTAALPGRPVFVWLGVSTALALVMLVAWVLHGLRFF